MPYDDRLIIIDLMVRQAVSNAIMVTARVVAAIAEPIIHRASEGWQGYRLYHSR